MMNIRSKCHPQRPIKPVEISIDRNTTAKGPITPAILRKKKRRKMPIAINEITPRNSDSFLEIVLYSELIATSPVC